MAYGTANGVEALLPVVGPLSVSSAPTLAQVEAWLAQGAAVIDRTLGGAGYSTPVGAVSAVYPELTALNELYAAAQAARARGLDAVQAENENRSDAWLAEFREQLAALAAADLSRLGVEVLPAAVASTAGRRFRLTQLKRVDGYSARYDDDGDMDA